MIVPSETELLIVIHVWMVIFFDFFAAFNYPKICVLLIPFPRVDKLNEGEIWNISVCVIYDFTSDESVIICKERRNIDEFFVVIYIYITIQ